MNRHQEFRQEVKRKGNSINRKTNQDEYNRYTQWQDCGGYNTRIKTKTHFSVQQNKKEKENHSSSLQLHRSRSRTLRLHCLLIYRDEAKTPAAFLLSRDESRGQVHPVIL